MIEEDDNPQLGRGRDGMPTDPRHASRHRPVEEEDRDVWPAMRRGWSGRCPECGGAPLFGSYLKIRERCPSCGEALHHHRADDMPAWATIMLVGHIVGFGVFHVEMSYQPPVWIHWAVWPAMAVGLSLWLLPRIKGAIVGLQWAKRMHGFDEGGGA